MCAVLSATIGRPKLGSISSLGASSVLRHTCVCSQQNLVGQTFVNLDLRCNSALMYSATHMCVPAAAGGQPSQAFATVDPWVKPEFYCSAAHMCMLTAAPGRPDLRCDISTLGCSPDLTCLKHTCVCARRSRWSAKPTGRPDPCNISTLGCSPDLICFATHMCMPVYARSSNWSGEPL